LDKEDTKGFKMKRTKKFMENEKVVKCENCGKEVPEDNLDKFGECSWCRADERANNMCVGDLKDK